MIGMLHGAGGPRSRKVVMGDARVRRRDSRMRQARGGIAALAAGFAASTAAAARRAPVVVGVRERGHAVVRVLQHDAAVVFYRGVGV